MTPSPEIGQIRRIGIVGAGNMGTMMSFGFSENGLDVSQWDVSEQNVEQAQLGIATAEDPHLLHYPWLVCLRKKTPEGDQNGEGKGDGGHVLDDILDKVVQDDEGTLYWSVMEAADRHFSVPTIAAGQFFRVASGNRAQRLKISERLNIPKPQKVDVKDKEDLIEKLRRAVYAAFLCSFCQGLELIARASKDDGWDINLEKCIQIWRAGCIIQENYIANILEPVFLSSKEPIMNIKLIEEVSSDLRKNFQPLKEITLKGIGWDNYVPSLSASLEYLKYVGGGMLATQFMEAEMDFFGAHAYDRPHVKREDPGKPSKGAHHYEWRPA